MLRNGVCPPPTNIKESDKEYEVEQILDYDDETQEYLVSWVEYPSEDTSWEPEDNRINAKEWTDEFWANRGDMVPMMKASRLARAEM